MTQNHVRITLQVIYEGLPVIVESTVQFCQQPAGLLNFQGHLHNPRRVVASNA